MNTEKTHTKGQLESWSQSVFTFRILMESGDLIVTTNTLAHVMRWEKNRGEKWGSGPVGVTGLTYLAWLAGRNDGSITETNFDAWAGQVVDIETIQVRRNKQGATEDPLDDVDGPGFADFTQPGPSDES